MSRPSGTFVAESEISTRCDSSKSRQPAPRDRIAASTRVRGMVEPSRETAAGPSAGRGNDGQPATRVARSRQRPGLTARRLGPQLAAHARMRGSWLIVLALSGCAAEDFVADPGDATWTDGGDKADGTTAVNVAATHLDIHLADHTAVATIDLEHNGNVELEASGLTIDKVHDDRGNRHFTKTTAGTKVSVFWLPNGKTAALAGTKHLVQAFDWYEQHIGPYAFGHDVASVSVVWGEGMYGGMEHHPYWHVATDAMNDEETHVPEAAHGWFGDGIRLRCWEDFVLTEGTVSYLAAHVLGEVGGPALEAAQWKEYQSELDDAIAEGGAPAWPTGCN